MAKKPDKSTRMTELRREAKELLCATERDVAALSIKDVQQLVRELQVQQIELDMQNEELRRAHIELETARDRYMNLYDFSPAGHLTLDTNGMIVEANLRAGTLLGVNRNELIGQQFSRFVASGDQDIFHRHCQEILKTGKGQTCEVQLHEKAGIGRWLYLESLAVREEPGSITCWWTALLDITLRKQGEAMLRSAQEQFEDIFEASREAIGYAALDGAILLVNRAFSELTGFSREELLRMNAGDLIPEQLKEQRDRVVAQVLQTGEPDEYEMDYLRKDGSKVPVSIALFAVKGEDGKSTGLGAIVRNLTERKRAEEQFRLVVESSPSGMLMVDENGTILLVNRQVEQQFGYERAELIGKPVEMLVPQHVRSHHAGDRAEFFAHSESRAMGKGRDLFGVRKDGTEFSLEIGLNPVQTPNGMSVLASVVDISERKRAEQTLKRERDFIGAVLEIAGALVVVLDREGRILRFNRACEQTTGYSSEEVMGQRVWDLFVIPDEVERVKAMFERLRGGEPRNDYENFWKGRGGFLRRISWSNTVIADPSGKVDYVVSSGLDITDLKYIEEQLRKTERIAELGTLASGMAHEIGTPMNVILGRAEYLLQRTADEGTKKGLTTIVTQIERITKVMNQLLAFARRTQPDRQVVDLGEIVENSLEMFQERMTHSRITVEKAIETDMPPVHADRDQLVQVMINLVTNSLHAMPEGGRLRLSLNREYSHVRLGVSDTGHGMPEEIRSKIFEPFFTTKDFGKGTGLGLTVVKGIIEEHGGTITVESVVGTGTTFWVRFPSGEAQSHT
ncbi:MAG: PAS domain S-box protein [Nitrospirota bacterium]